MSENVPEFVPSREQIERECARIQREWDDEDERQRRCDGRKRIEIRTFRIPHALRGIQPSD